MGKITIRLLDQDDIVVSEKTADNYDGIGAGTAGQFLIDMTGEAPRFELENKDGKIEAGTGKFIKRL